MIRIRGLRKTFRPYRAPKSWFHAPPVPGPLPVLEGLDLDVRRGEIVGIRGPNGCGKSTLLRIIAGLIAPDGGLLEREGDVGLLDEEHFTFSERLTAEQNLIFFAALRGIPGEEARARFRMDASALGVEELLPRRVNAFSAGMEQMLRWLLCLLPRPEILLMDEPMVSLDRERAAAAAALLGERVREGGYCAVAVGHEPRRLDRLCDRVLRLEGGVLR